MTIQKQYWEPNADVYRVVESLASNKKRILEIGPGPIPFTKATEFIDYQSYSDLSNKSVKLLDINEGLLPYEDKSFDFIYCRHTLEDIYNPFGICREMSRVGKAGYIETPSPLAECCRGTDAPRKSDGSLEWRGYSHHRYIVWSKENTLYFLPKLPLIEHLPFSEALEEKLYAILNAHSFFWNTYFFWEDKFEVKRLEQERDFDLLPDYGSVIYQAIVTSFETNTRLASKHGFQLPLQDIKL